MQLTIDDVGILVKIDGRLYRNYGNKTDKWGRTNPHVEGYYGEILGWVVVGCKNKIARVREVSGI